MRQGRNRHVYVRALHSGGRLMKLYEITANCRPNPEQPCFYLYAPSKRKAQDRLKSLVAWVKIYEIIELSEEEAAEVSSNADLHPESYSIW